MMTVPLAMGGCILLTGLAGILLLRLATGFIAHVEGLSAPPPLPQRTVLLLSWLFISSSLFLSGFQGWLPTMAVTRGLLVAAWCLVLASLDLARYWLPLSFTATMTLAGMIFSVLSEERETLRLAAEVIGTFLVLWQLRMFVNRLKQNEVFGLGDVWLLTALVSWFPVFDVLLVTLLALLSAVCFGLFAKRQYLPFGPFLCMFAVLPAFISMERYL